MASATKDAPKTGAAKVDGAALYDALLKQAKQAKVGTISETKGMYFRVQAGGRTAAYVVKGKTVATVYPCALAESMPDTVTFRKVELGAHHYGRGEVIISVGGEDDFANALAALAAAVKAPAPPKKAKGQPEQEIEAAVEGDGPAVTPNTVVLKDGAAGEDLPATTTTKRSRSKKVTA